MKAVTTILAGGVAAIALASSAQATAQYYPGYTNTYPAQPYGGQGAYGNGVQPYGGQGAYGNGAQPYGGQGAYGYGANQQAIVNQCAAAVQQRPPAGRS